MRPIITDRVAWSVVCHSCEPCKNGRTDQDSLVWNVDSGEPKEALLDGGKHGCNLANVNEPSVNGGNATFLSNYFDHLLLL